MFETTDRPRRADRALLVRACLPHADRRESLSLLDELAELVDTLGVPVIERVLVHVREPRANLLLGRGTAQEIVDRARALGADLLVFDNELTPAQQRNWDKLSGIAVLDRQEVILDIFARRARTREARLQVELARMEYALPRLKCAWAHLGQQRGGIAGSRGEGETQLEMDRRMVRARIDRLKRDLGQVRIRRATQRKDRQRVPVPCVAVVGYTNAGKSSLLRRLTGAQVLVEDRLFATLDPTTRRLVLPGNRAVLLTDTVGFIRELPHHLVDAFRATLEEVVQSDLLIHLLDITQPRIVDLHRTTLGVLRGLGAADTPAVTALNKIDLLPDRSALAGLRLQFPGALAVSAATGEGIDELVAVLAGLISPPSRRVTLRIPASRGDLVARLHRETRVHAIRYEADAARIEADLTRDGCRVFESYIIPAPEDPGAAITTGVPLRPPARGGLRRTRPRPRASAPGDATAD